MGSIAATSATSSVQRCERPDLELESAENAAAVLGLDPATDAPPVQRLEADASASCEDPVHRAAREGTGGPATGLPFQNAVQASFGKHDVSGVQAHIGGRATDACAAMGASAYATGNHVAFAGSPDLHTVAHELAHVVQQRGGVQLAGGVGQGGDVYEQHADRVADRVVAGESAEATLDELAAGTSGATSSTAVQKNDTAAGQAPLLLELSDPYLEFAAAELMTLSGRRTVTVTNDGYDAQPLDIEGISGDLTDFHIYGAAVEQTVLLEPGQLETLAIEFQPTETGHRQATWLIGSDAAAVELTVSGRGRPHEQANDSTDSAELEPGLTVPKRPAETNAHCDDAFDVLREGDLDLGFPDAKDTLDDAWETLRRERQSGVTLLKDDANHDDAPQVERGDTSVVSVLVEAAVGTMLGGVGKGLVSAIFGSGTELWRQAMTKVTTKGLEAARAEIEAAIMGSEDASGTPPVGLHYADTMFYDGVGAGIDAEIDVAKTNSRNKIVAQITQDLKASGVKDWQRRAFDEIAALRCHILDFAADIKERQFMDTLMAWCVALARLELPGETRDSKPDAHSTNMEWQVLNKDSAYAKDVGMTESVRGVLHLDVGWKGQLRGDKWHQQRAEEIRTKTSDPSFFTDDISEDIGTTEIDGDHSGRQPFDQRHRNRRLHLDEQTSTYTDEERQRLDSVEWAGQGQKVGADGKVYDYGWGRENKGPRQAGDGKGSFDKFEYVEKLVETEFQPYIQGAHLTGLNEVLRARIGALSLRELEIPVRMHVQPGDTLIARDEAGRPFAEGDFIDAYYDAVIAPQFGYEIPREGWKELVAASLFDNVFGSAPLNSYVSEIKAKA